MGTEDRTWGWYMQEVEFCLSGGSGGEVGRGGESEVAVKTTKWCESRRARAMHGADWTFLRSPWVNLDDSSCMGVLRRMVQSIANAWIREETRSLILVHSKRRMRFLFTRSCAPLARMISVGGNHDSGRRLVGPYLSGRLGAGSEPNTCAQAAPDLFVVVRE